MTKYKTVADMHETWAGATINPEADEIQRRELEMAFYAGVWSIINHMMVVGGDETVTEDEGADHFEALRVETRTRMDICLGQMKGEIPPDGEVHH